MKQMKLVLAMTALLALVVPTLMAGTAEDATALFKSKCVMCHGADGSGDTTMGKKLAIRDLRSDDVQKQTDEQLLEIIAKGKGKMPIFEGKIPADAMKSLVAHIRSLKK